MNKKQQSDKTQSKNERVDMCTDKLQYQKPTLLPLGDIRDVTMGGSPGFGDSGAGAPEDPF